ncbi:MAG: hypothetical protein LC658_00245 [Bacteroidales bacterium]|nr:hypothetical protein [Bacteroidales bacterium]
MRTNKLRFANFIFAFVFIAVSTLFSNGIQAQETEKGFILSVTEFTIKSGHDMQFREGVKAWKACYLENGGEWTWNLWHRKNGKGNVYVLSSRMANWAEMDETDDAGKNCRDIGRELINPHVETAENNFARYIPEFSMTSPNPGPVIWVNNWKVNNGTRFREIVKEVTGAVAKAEGSPRGFWYNVMGGNKDVGDFFVTTPFANYAAMDVDRENVWNIYEKANGKEKRDQMQAEFREIVEESWSYLYKLADDLSHNPPAE